MAKFLSDSDVTKLRRLISDVGTLRGQIRTLHDRTKGGERAGAHYIMLTPSGGIPAATGSPLVPGEADCLIQWAAGSGTREVTDTTRPEKVYNLSGSAIPGGELVIAHRDAWGDLWAYEVSGCADIGLPPGSYPATAGASIAAGATGSVVYDGGVYAATNQSQCPVVIGNRVGLHVSPKCELFFVPCVCDCSATPPADCCDKTIAICVNGNTQIVPVSCEEGIGGPWTGGTWYYFSVGSCCVEFATEFCRSGLTPGNPDFMFFAVKVCCSEDVITAYYGFTCTLNPPVEENPNSGQFNWSALCDTPPVTQTENVLVTIADSDLVCGVTIVAAAAASADLCEACEEDPDPPSDCCDQSLYFCLNGVSQLLAVSGGNYTWDVSACCDATASLEITLSCNSDTDTISLFYEYTAGEVYAAGTENVIMSQFCNDGAPRFITFTNSPCFLQMLVSEVQFECAECTGGATTTEPPPP